MALVKRLKVLSSSPRAVSGNQKDKNTQMNLFGFTLTVTDVWLLGGVAVLLPFVINPAISRRRAKEDRFAIACSVFRSNLSIALTELDARQNIANTVIYGSASHDSAITDFRLILSGNNASGFDSAVAEYKECRRNVGNPDEERDYSVAFTVHVDELRESINALLRFANKT